MDKIGLIDEVKKVCEMVYVLYLKFKVGVVLLMKDGKVYCGCNIENVVYSMCNCVECMVLFKVYLEGDKEYVVFVVVVDIDCFVFLCGVCR